VNTGDQIVVLANFVIGCRRRNINTPPDARWPKQTPEIAAVRLGAEECRAYVERSWRRLVSPKIVNGLAC